MFGIVNLTDPGASGTFKFQYSRTPAFRPTPFIPDDKRLAEKIIASYFCEFRRKYNSSNIQNFRLNEDDGHKNPDVLFEDNGITKGIQITQLSFTEHKTRKIISRQNAIRTASHLAKLYRSPVPVNINIMPTAPKRQIKKADLKVQAKIEYAITVFIIDQIKSNLEALKTISPPIWILVENNLLSSYFKYIVLNPIPTGFYSRFYGKNNMYVNYDFDDVSFTAEDIANEIDNMFRKKDNGIAEILLIWADKFELGVQEDNIYKVLCEKFTLSSFRNIYFMTFENNLPMFTDSLRLWTIKQENSIST